MLFLLFLSQFTSLLPKIRLSVDNQVAALQNPPPLGCCSCGSSNSTTRTSCCTTNSHHGSPESTATACTCCCSDQSGWDPSDAPVLAAIAPPIQVVTPLNAPLTPLPVALSGPVNPNLSQAPFSPSRRHPKLSLNIKVLPVAKEMLQLLLEVAVAQV